MLDDLRRNDSMDDFDESVEEDDEFGIDNTEEETTRRFLGMTAVERMFLSIFFFMNVVVLGLAFLVATGRIVL
ncbi:MAG: hypothetical protein K8I30_14280 [Anaerolineae bacterium]|nr:hypothetical protein [Anaerolineae bacterium]